MKIKRLWRSIVRLVPVFLLFAVVGCLLGRYVFHIPLDLLGVVVSVPVVVIFGITRLLVLAVPREPSSEHRSSIPSTWAKISAVQVTLCFFTAIVMALSAVAYKAIGLSVIALGSIKFSLLMFLAAVTVFTIRVFIALLAHVSVHQIVSDLCEKTILIFWDLLRLPTQLSIRIYGDFGNPMSNYHQRF
jgi:hypothetical protein